MPNVFTNGVFDLIHIGHIHLFKECRRLSGHLGQVWVGTNGNKSAYKWKGIMPIMSSLDRREMLESIKYIDRVFIFTEDNPLELIKRLKPDILVKGDDYKLSQVCGRQFVQSYGGKVVLFPLTVGMDGIKLSSSRFKQRMRKEE